MTGRRWRSRDMRRTESPDCVNVHTRSMPSWCAICAAAAVIAPPRVCGVEPSEGIRSRPSASVASMMRAIVRTDSSQCAPIEVSPDSMRASAPSSTAFAQSLASARVGRGDSIIDSSICVATMTGLACRRATSIARFCTIGTSSSGSSTPRSPRATMTPSKAATISWRRSIACGFSSFAMTGRCTSTSAMTRRTSSMSSGPRTKLSATQSAPCARPQRRSARSFSVSAGTDTATPGRLMPL